VSHGDGLPVPEPPDSFAVYSDDNDSVSSNSEEQQPSSSRDADYLPSTDSSNHKVKAGVFISPQMRLFKDQQFEAVLSDKEKAAWQSFEKFSNGFLGNFKAANFTELVQNLMVSYEQLGCNMSLKMHFLFSPLDFFPLNCGDVSDEHGKRFHQDISVMEHRFKGKWSAARFGDYCWMMKRDARETKYHRQAKRTRR
jgi:hypothetical protein